MKRRFVFGVFALAFACSHSEEDKKRDGRTIQELAARDETGVALAEVDALVDQDKPYLAATTLESGPIKLARAQLRRAENLSAHVLKTDEGKALRMRFIRVYRSRVDCLEAYRRVLARGAADAQALLRSLQCQSQAEHDLVALDDAVKSLRRLRESPKAAASQ